jgi:hypothetical protein
MGALSSSMSNAGAGLLPNPPADVGIAIIPDANLTANLTAYSSINVVAQYSNVVVSAKAAVGNGIASSTVTQLLTLGVSNFPAVTDLPSSGNTISGLLVYGTPANVAANIYFVSDAITYDSNAIMGNGDLTIFCQSFMGAQGYVLQANGVLNSVRNSEVLAQTFNKSTGGMDTLSTGGLNQVSNNLPKLSQDLLAIGNIIGLSNLENLGLPGELLAQIGRATGGGIAAISDLMLAAGISSDKIRSLGRGENTLTSTEEKRAYEVMTTVKGSTLEQVLFILKSTLTTTQIVNMSQLLNPKAILPNSWSTLLCPLSDKLENVYLSNGSVNTGLEVVLSNPGVTVYSGPNNTNSLNVLKLITPPDQAVANKALSRSLQQIKNIAGVTLPNLARAMSVVETNAGLGKVGNLTAPVPSSVQNFYKSTLAKGSGPNGTVILNDVIGVAVGYKITDNLYITRRAISNIGNTGALGNLSNCYSNMSETLAGAYGEPAGPVIIPSGPGAGTYTTWDEAFTTGLIPAANTTISTIVTSNNTEVTKTNQAWGNIILTLSNQTTNQTSAELAFGNLQPNSTSAAMSFTTNLHSYGIEVAPGGANEYLEKVANRSSLSGQSVISSLREGRNIQSLQSAGIKLDTQLSSK